MGGLDIRLQDPPDPSAVAAIEAGLVAYNDDHGMVYRPWPVTVVVQRGDAVAGGANATVQGSWLYVRHLWVSHELRGNGVGTAVMDAVEAAGRERGCRAVWLDTFSFQARPFYEARGFELFGQLADFPPGHQRYFLWKPL